MTINKLASTLGQALSVRPAGIDKLDRLWEAAVFLPIVETSEGPSLLFQVRSQNLRHQPGEICFPGGRYECKDGSFATTALRETCEELGLALEDLQLLGELDALVTHTGPIIHPFVGLLKAPEKIVYNPSEVESIFTVPLSFFLNQEPLRCAMKLADQPGPDFPYDLVPQRQRSWRFNKAYYCYFYQYQGRVIWGLTARMLYSFIKNFGPTLKELLKEEHYE